MQSNLYIKDIFDLFADVQSAQIFADQKMMADAVPKVPVSVINENYALEKNQEDFNLREFVLKHFDFYTPEPFINITDKLPIAQHIEKLWDELRRNSFENRGSLLSIPKPYIVPGGRFNEFFYWDSYFVMLGLQVSGRIEMMHNIVENCAYLIDNFGFVPNGNRTYFLSRSQPPFFSLMLDLIFESTNNPKIYLQYFNTLEKEYQFWMSGESSLENNLCANRTCKTKSGEILNRYFDAENEPRPESYLIDIEDAKTGKNPNFFRNIRAACESGWDFSSRWFKDADNIQSIQTLDLAEVDLNCLLWHLEKTLEKTAELLNLNQKVDHYKQKADKRKTAIQNNFWDESTGLYRDYNFVTQEKTASEHIATLFPLFFNLADENQAKSVAENLEKLFLKNGGLITTTENSGQQWDSPNAWAPFQYMGYVALKNYGLHETAEKIKENWCSNVERVYKNTGKLMEKYNAVDTDSLAGGGEYPNQDGFGWTNGVYLKLKSFTN